MESSPFFSVVIPTFNRAQLLQKAVASVLAQTFANWELIIVDDGSTDNTAEVIRAIGDPRVRYVYQKNAERSAARNNGIAHATGQYICFLDSDDYYLPDRLLLLYNELNKHHFPNGFFYTSRVIDNGSGNLVPCEEKLDNNGSVFDRIASQTIGNPQACVSRNIVNEFRFDPAFKVGEDRELWLRIAQKYPFTYFDNQATFVVGEHDDRSVNVMRYNSGAEQLKLYQYVFSDAHPGKNVSRPIRLFLLAGSYHLIAQYHIHQGHRWAASMAIARALNTDKKSDWSKFRLNILFKLITFSPMEKIKNLIDYA